LCRIIRHLGSGIRRAVRQSKTILAKIILLFFEIAFVLVYIGSKIGFCSALAAERGGQSATNLNMNTLTLCPFIGFDCLKHTKRTPGAVKKYDRIFSDKTIIR